MNKDFLSEVIVKYGMDKQLDMCIEEMSELTKAICKFKRGVSKVAAEKNDDIKVIRMSELKKEISNIEEEVADCEIMFEQIKIMFNCEDEVNEQIEFKLNRLKERLKNEKK